jgi:pimeloyl-ACP methyl ester carboxylesterase
MLYPPPPQAMVSKGIRNAVLWGHFFLSCSSMKWLILRGLVREQRHWHGFREVLEQKLKQVDPDAEVYAIDLAGFGTEVSRISPTTITGIVEDIRVRWKNMKKHDQENWGILAVSLGGMVAANWTSRFPDDFKKAVLINSSMSGLSPIQDRMIPKNYPTIIRLLLSRNLVHREKTILGMTTNLNPEKIAERAEKQADYGKDVNKINAVYQILAAILFRAPQTIRVPMMVLVGDGDTLVSPKCSEAIAKKYQAQLNRHPTANHDLATDDPHWVADQVASWR